MEGQTLLAEKEQIPEIPAQCHDYPESCLNGTSKIKPNHKPDL
jgi:hypothetical protein